MAERRQPDWQAWHSAYDDPASRLSRRLAAVQARLREAIDERPGPIALTSMCCGQGRDVIGVLADHPRRDDVTATLVELDATLAADARASAAAVGITRIDVRAADASRTDVYADVPRADILLACGIFGNISDDDIRHCIAHLPMLCAPAATVLWTRYANAENNVIPMINEAFASAGFDLIGVDVPDGETYRVGAHRFAGAPPSLAPGVTLFTFTRER